MSELTNSQTQSKITPSYLIHSIICTALMIGIRWLPPISDVTPYGMEILGIFLGSIYGWVFVGYLWPSFIGMILLGCSEYGTIAAVWGEGFGDSTVLNLLLTFVFFVFINQTGLMQYMANKFISLKINIGHPWLLTFFFFFIASYIGGITNNIAVTILLWYIFYGICDKVGYKKGDRYVSYMICGIVFFAAYSIVLFPFLPFSIVGMGIMQKMVPFGDYSILGWMISGPLINFLLILCYLFIGKFIFRVDISKLSDKEDRFAELRNTKMGKSEKVGLVYLLLFILIVCLPTFMPKAWAITGILSNMSIIGACGLCFSGMFFLKDEHGNSILSMGKLMGNVNWDMIFLMIATVPICSAMEASETGIMASVMKVVMPVVNSVSPAVFLILVIVIIGLITQFAHNFILLLVFGPTLCQLASSMGIPPIAFCAIFMMTIMNAVATPGASANSAMLFGNTDWLEKKHGFILGFLFIAFAYILYIFIGIPINIHFA
ncbi:MAG: SLC13 family permease [Peptococcaceae bacterium]